MVKINPNKTMEEELVTLETATLAKEKGFDWKVIPFFGRRDSEDYTASYGYFEEVMYTYDERDKPSKHIVVRDFKNHNSEDYSSFAVKRISRPSQSLLQKWLRDKYDIHIEIEYWDDSTWSSHLVGNMVEENVNFYHVEDCKTYEEALEKALFHALTLINNESSILLF